jgi:hypothetical protein
MRSWGRGTHLAVLFLLLASGIEPGGQNWVLLKHAGRGSCRARRDPRTGDLGTAPAVRSLRGGGYQRGQDVIHEEGALEMYENALREKPDHADLWCCRARECGGSAPGSSAPLGFRVPLAV